MQHDNIITLRRSTPLGLFLVVVDGLLPAGPGEGPCPVPGTGRRRGPAPAQLGRARQSRVEVDPLVEVPHLHVARLLLVVLVGEVAEALRCHPEEIDDLPVVG